MGLKNQTKEYGQLAEMDMTDLVKLFCNGKRGREKVKLGLVT